MAKFPKAVVEIGQMHIEGNIIPHSWYSHLTFQNGKPQLAAIHILSDILYWYRPTEIRDEGTGKVIGYKKKFKADKLQRNYQYYVDLYGFGKDQVRNAVDYLVDFGVITREFRHFTSKTGVPMSNVMFVEPIPEKLKEITYSQLDNDHIGIETDMGRHENRDGTGTETDTYTKTTTEITTEKGATPEMAECDPDLLLSFGIFGQTQAEQITDLELQAQRDIVSVWIKYIADDTKMALVAFLVAMRRKYPNFAPPRDKNGQGEWGKGVNDHLANYALADLPGLYAAAIQLQIDNGLDIYRPQSLDKAMIKCRQQMGTNGQKVVASY